MSERVFVTGATGYLGSYALQTMLRHSDAEFFVLTRAKDESEGLTKLWKALQLHMDGPEFWSFVPRIRLVRGDLSTPQLGIDHETYREVVSRTDSVLHIAASLNRKSSKQCLNHNLRGTLAVIKLARAAADHHGLRRFSFVSTSAVAGKRQGATLSEDEVIDWNLSDYDPYGRTKKFCEHMVEELLPDVETVVFRPSTIMGDSRFPETTQFDMVRAFNTVFELPAFPIQPDARVDIANADWAGSALGTIHLKRELKYDVYHLSSGTASPTAREMAPVFSRASGKRAPVMVPSMLGATQMAFNAIASLPQKNDLTLVGSLFKVFLPYITYDTVFDNRRAVEELGKSPARFVDYGPAFTSWARSQHYRYAYRPLPAKPTSVSADPAAPGRAEKRPAEKRP